MDACPHQNASAIVMIGLAVIVIGSLAGVRTLVLGQPVRLIGNPGHARSPQAASRNDAERGAVAIVGGYVRRRAGRSANLEYDRRAGRILVGAFVGLVVSAPLAAVGAVAGFGCDVQQRRAAARRRTAGLSEGLAEVVDLFRIAVSNGANLLVATRQVTPWLPDIYRVSFEHCLRDVDTGSSFVDALERIPLSLGPQIRPLIAALVASERYGAPIGQGLQLLAVESRADRRRQFEQAARRLPVAMVFPLVVCVLPAFMLLTVVPVVVDTVERFDVIGLG